MANTTTAKKKYVFVDQVNAPVSATNPKIHRVYKIGEDVPAFLLKNPNVKPHIKAVLVEVDDGEAGGATNGDDETKTATTAAKKKSGKKK